MSLVLRPRYDDWWGHPKQLTWPFVIISLTGFLVITLGSSFLNSRIWVERSEAVLLLTGEDLHRRKLGGKWKTKICIKFLAILLDITADAPFCFGFVQKKAFLRPGSVPYEQNFSFKRQSKVIWQSQGWTGRSGNLWEEGNSDVFFSNLCYQFAVWIWAGHLILWFPSTLTRKRYAILQQITLIFFFLCGSSPFTISCYRVPNVSAKGQVFNPTLLPSFSTAFLGCRSILGNKAEKTDSSFGWPSAY